MAREGAAMQGAHSEGVAAVPVAVAGADAWSAEAREVSARLQAKDAELDCLATQTAQAQDLLEHADASAAARLAQMEGLLTTERAGFAARLVDATGAAEARAVAEACEADACLVRVEAMEEAMVALDDELAAARAAADEADDAARVSGTKIEQLEAQIAELVASDAASDARAQAVAQAASEAAWAATEAAAQDIAEASEAQAAACLAQARAGFAADLFFLMGMGWRSGSFKQPLWILGFLVYIALYYFS